MRDRLLIRLFLQRLLDHELVSSHADRREVLSLAVGALVAVGLFLAVVLAVKYQFNQYMPPGLTAVFSLDDRVLFVSLSMIVLALVAVAEWDALALDPRDTAVLGVLPIPRAVVVRSKFVAALVFGGSFAVALNLAPTLLRAVALPERLPIPAVGVLWLTLGHGIVTLLAGAFAFLAVFSLRELLQGVLGTQRFARVSAWVQAALIVMLVLALLLLPRSYGGASRWLHDGRISPRANPAAWFVGLHERMVGSVIDGLPRGTPPRFQAAAEGRATAEYDGLRPLFSVLARLAISALMVAVIAAVASCAFNGRRWPLPPVTGTRRWGAAARTGQWLVTRVIAPHPAMQAGFSFTLQTLFRQASHRTTLAAFIALGLAAVVLMATSADAAVGDDLGSIPVTALAAQTVWLAAALGGFRQAVRLPAYSSGTQTFQLAWNGDTGPFVAGVKRAAWVAVVLPALAGAAVWHLVVLGLAAALWHGVVGIAVAALMMEGLFFSYRGLPFASGYVPSDTLKAGGLVLLIAVINGALALAWLERTALETSATTATFIGALAVMSVLLHVIQSQRRCEQEPAELHGGSDSGTQRLELVD